MYRPKQHSKKDSLLARLVGRMLGAGKPKVFSVGVSSTHRSRPAWVQEYFKSRAAEKRARRAARPGCSTYARANGPKEVPALS